MRADYDVHRTFLDTLDDARFCSLGGLNLESASIVTGNPTEPVREGMVMLLGEHRGGHEHGDLFESITALKAARMATSVFP